MINSLQTQMFQFPMFPSEWKENTFHFECFIFCLLDYSYILNGYSNTKRELILRNIRDPGNRDYSALRSRLVSIIWRGFYVLKFVPWSLNLIQILGKQIYCKKSCVLQTWIKINFKKNLIRNFLTFKYTFLYNLL